MGMRVCSEPGCGEITEDYHCPAHKPKAWESSTRREKVRSGWAQQKRARYVLSRDDSICHICQLPGATIADHVVPLAEGGADDLENLKSAHEECHARKNQAEAQRGLRNR